MKRVFAVIFSLVMALGLLSSCSDSGTDGLSHKDPESAGSEYTEKELIEAMGLGWNLGNTLDAPEGETSWGQPETTREMIDALKELGFNTIRIPTSWGQHNSGAPDYIIDEEWMDRVNTIVDWALDNDMFVILNSHHDNDFYFPSGEHTEESVNYITKIWTQIAERFKDYDQHLIFEPMNEPRLTGTQYEWNFDASSSECLEAESCIRQCNQACVDVVRASGGKNADRYILASTYCGSPYSALSDAYSLPEDPSNKLMLSIHAYTPYDLAMNKSLAINEFTDASKASIDDFMDKIYNKFVANGVHAVITECGCTNKGNDEDRRAWGEYFVSKAKSCGMVCVVWDNAHIDLGEECYGLFDRYNLKVYDESLAYYEGMLAGLK